MTPSNEIGLLMVTQLTSYAWIGTHTYESVCCDGRCRTDLPAVHIVDGHENCHGYVQCTASGALGRLATFVRLRRFAGLIAAERARTGRVPCR